MKLLILILSFFSLNLYSQNQIIDFARKIQKQYDTPRKDYVVIIDYRKSIDEERLYLVDTKLSKIEIVSKVSHAKNSGLIFCKDFSNVLGSRKSSYGAFVTEKSKYGKYGFSLIISGLEKDKNDNAKIRNIIFHSTKKMKTKWSQGCFATPENINSKLIRLIENGILVYVVK